MADPLDLFRLDGRVALVTGGSRGLGATIAETLASAGADVALMSRTEADLTERARTLAASTGRRVVAVPGDVADEAEVAAAVDATATELGRLDILVNNAGINVRGAIEEVDRDGFERSLAVNVTGAWLLCRAAAPLLKASPSGRVVNIASTFGLVAAPERTAYTAAKGALIQLTRALAMEWAADGVNVNAVAPGPFLTEMNLPFKDSEHAVRVITQEVALRRWGELHEIHGAVLFLASDAASYVTGSVVVVDGGWTAH